MVHQAWFTSQLLFESGNILQYLTYFCLARGQEFSVLLYYMCYEQFGKKTKLMKYRRLKL